MTLLSKSLAFRTSRLLLVLILVLIGSAPLRAQNPYVWQVGSNGNWSVAGNWLDSFSNSGVPPSSATTILSFLGDGVNFYTSNNDAANPFILDQLLLNGAGGNSIYQITGNDLDFQGTTNLISQTGTGQFLISNNISFTSALTLNASLFSAPVTLSGTIAGSGSLTKTGYGTVVLQGNNVGFSGPVSINQGSLVIRDANALGTGAITVNGTTTLGSATGFSGGELVVAASLNSPFTIGNSSTSLSGGGPTGLGVAYNGIGNITFTNPVTTTSANATRLSSNIGMTSFGDLTLGAAQTGTFNGNGHYSVNGVLAASGGSTTSVLSKAGAGTLILNNTNTGSNFYTGRFILSGGFMRVSHGGALGNSASASAIDLTAGSLEIRSDNASTFSGNIALDLSSSSTLFVSRAVGGTGLNQTASFGVLSQDSSDTLTLTGRNGYSVTIADLTVNASSGNYALAANFNGTFTLNGGANGLVWGVNSSTNRTMTITSTAETVVNAAFSASGTGAHVLTKAGTGTLSINAPGAATSTYTGATNISAGTLAVNSFAQVFGSTSQVNIGSTTTTAGALAYTGVGETSAVPINLNTTTASAFIYANQAAASPLILSGPFTATGLGNKTLHLAGTNTTDNEIQSAIPNSTGFATSLLKFGTGTWVLSGANGFTGTTTIAGGTLKIQDTFSGSSRDVLPDAANVIFAVTTMDQGAGGTLQYRGVDSQASAELVGQLVATGGAGTVQVVAGAGGTATLTFSDIGTRALDGGVVNFIPGTNGTIAFTTFAGTRNPNGVIIADTADASAYATLNGTDWANVVAGNVVAATYTTDLPVSGTGSSTVNILENRTTFSTTGAVTVNTLKVAPADSNGVTLTLGGALTLTNRGVLFDTAAGPVVVNGTGANSLGVGNVETVIVVNGANTATVNARIGGTSSSSFTKAGTGTLILTGANTYTSSTNILEGTVQLSGATVTMGSLSSGPGAFNLRQGATFDLNGAGASATIMIGGLSGSGTITNSGGGSNTASTLNIGLLGTTATTGTFTGLIEDGDGIININKNSSGLHTFVGLNTYSGFTSINAGTLAVTALANGGQPSSIGQSTNAAANLVFSNGTLLYTGSSGTVYQSTQTPSVSTDRLFTLAGNATIQSSGTYGNTLVAAGSASHAALVFNNTGAIAFSGAGIRTLTLGGTSIGDNEIALELTNNPNASEALSVTKADAGLWILSNNSNSYSGTTTVSNGVLQITANSGSLPNASPLSLSGILQSSGTFTRTASATPAAGEVNWLAGGFAASSAKLSVNIGGAGATLTFGGAGFIPSLTTLQLNSTTALSEVELVNGLDLAGATQTITVNDNTSTSTDFAVLSGVISNGSLTKAGAGTLYLTGANSYTGNTSVTAGSLAVNSLGNSNATNGPVTTTSSLGNNGGFLSLGNATTTGANLWYVGSGEVSDRQIRINTTTATVTLDASGSGALVLTNSTNLNDMVAGAKTLTLRGFNNDANVLASNLANNGGALTVTKTDGGTWVLSGTNTYTGLTTITSGSLGVGSASAISTTSSLVLDASIFAHGADRVIAPVATWILDGSKAVIGNYSLEMSTPVRFGAADSTGADGANTTLTNSLVSGKVLTISGTLQDGDTDNARRLIINGTGVTAITGVIQDGTTALTVTHLEYSGTSTLTIGGGSANTYTGTTHVTNGTIILAKTLTPVGTGPLNLSGGNLQATVDLSGVNALANPVTVSSATATVSGTNSFQFNGSTTNNAGNRTLTNSLTGGAELTLAGEVRLSESASNRTLTLAGAGTTNITGQINNGTGPSTASNLTINAVGGTINLANTGTPNSYNNTTITQGTVRLGADEQIPHGASTGTLIFDPAASINAILDLNGRTETVNGITATTAGNPIIDNTAVGTATLIFGDNNGVVNFAPTGAGEIKNTGGALSISKIGSGAATITTAGPLAYTGSTSVSGGSMTINSALSGTTALQVTGTNSLLHLAGNLSNPTAITSLTVDAGSTLSLINGTGIPLASLTSLSLGGAGTAILNIELGTASDLLTLSTNPATTAGTVEFNLQAVAGFGAATYDLITAPSGLSGATYALDLVPGGFTYAFNNSDSLVQLVVTAAVAPTLYWRGSIDNSWLAYDVTPPNTNWSTDLAGTTISASNPAATTSVIFSSTAVTGSAIATTLDGNVSIQDLTFTSNPAGVTSVSIAPGTPAGILTITPASSLVGITVDDNAGAITISAPVVLGADQTWTVVGTGANGSSLGVSAVVSGTANLTKGGAGVLTLSAANTYVGSTTISAGTLTYGVANALPATTAVNLTSATAVLNMNNLNGTIASLAGVAGSTVSLGSGDLTVSDPAASTVFNGVITGIASGNLIKLGASTLELTGTNTNIGAVNVNGGILRTTGTGTIGLATGTTVVVTIANADVPATLELNGANQEIDGLTFGGSGNVTVNSPAQGTLTIGGSTTITLGGNVTYTATNNPLGATIQGGSINMNGSRTITVNNSTQAATDLTISSAIPISSSGTSRTLTITGAGDTLISGLISNGAATGSALAKSGAGTLELTNTNTYGGTTTLNAGTISVTGALGRLGTAALVIGNAAGTPLLSIDSATVAQHTTITFGGATATATTQATISIAATRILNFNGNVTYDATNNPLGAVIQGAGTFRQIGGNRTITVNDSANAAIDLTISADVALSNTATARTLTVTGAGTTLISGVISNGTATTSNLTKLGTGTLTISNASTYSGTTSVNNGTLMLSGAGLIGSGALVVANADVPALLNLNGATQGVTTITFGGAGNVTVNSPAQGTIDIGASGTLTLGGNATYDNTGNPLGAVIQNGTLTLSGDRIFTVNDSTQVATDVTISSNIALSNGATNRDLTVTGAGNTVISGNITNGGTATASTLTKTGSGRLTLLGTASHNGATSVSGTNGVLQIGSTGNITASTTTVSGAGTLSGTGQLADVTVGAGILVPGDISTGLGALTVNGTLQLNTGSFWAVALVAEGTPAAPTTGGSDVGTFPNTTNHGALVVNDGNAFVDLSQVTFAIVGAGAVYSVNGENFSYQIASGMGDQSGTLINDPARFQVTGLTGYDSLSITGNASGAVFLNVAVPEPATVLGIVAGCSGALRLIRRRRSKEPKELAC